MITTCRSPQFTRLRLHGSRSHLHFEHCVALDIVPSTPDNDIPLVDRYAPEHILQMIKYAMGRGGRCSLNNVSLRAEVPIS